jgi:hypothetical protein
MSINQLNALFRVCGKKFVGGVRVWGVGCGVWWGFTDFEGVNYLGSAEKVFRWGLGVGGWGLGVGGWGLGVGVWGVGCGILPIFRWSIT